MRLIAPAILAAVTTLAAPVLAQTALDTEAFDAYTRGRTLSFSSQGQAYGFEQYLPNQRVRWAFAGQECQEGVWYERSGMICFLYEDAPSDEQCWIFTQTDTGLRGVFQGPDGPGTELYEIEQTDQPLSCAAPGVGV